MCRGRRAGPGGPAGAARRPVIPPGASPTPARAHRAAIKALVGALRAYAQALHAEQREAGAHVTTVTIGGLIKPGDERFDPKTIAALFLDLHRRPRDRWRDEIVHPV